MNEPLLSRYIHRMRTLPCGVIVRRASSMIRKQAMGGLLPFPQNIHIEVTNHCNLNCPMCVYSGQTRTKGFISFGLFKEIVRQCEGKRSLEKMALMGLGEPFLHPELIEMSRYAKSRGNCHIFTSTNATLLREEESKNVLSKSGFDIIAISIDGATKETYEKVRKGADFDIVTANIIRFINMRKKLKKRAPGVVLQFLVMKDNYQEKNDFVRYWKDKLDRYDTIMLRDVDTFGGQVEDHRLASQMPRVKRAPCVQLWRDMIISWDGDVSVCCKDVNYILKVGSVNNTPISVLWENSAWSQLRSLHKKRLWNEVDLCSRCSEWR